AYYSCGTYSSILVGARHRLNHDVLHCTGGHTVTGQWRGVATALYSPPRGAGHSSLHRLGLCGSARRTRLASPHLGHRARTAPPGWSTTMDRGPGAPPATAGRGARLFGDTLMLQLSPQSRIFVATE